MHCCLFTPPCSLCPSALQALSKLARLPDPEPAAAGDKKAAEAAQRVDAARKQAGRCLLRVLDALDVWVGPIKDSMLRGADAEAAAAEQVGGVRMAGTADFVCLCMGGRARASDRVFNLWQGTVYCDTGWAWAVSWCSGSAHILVITGPRRTMFSSRNHGY